VLGRVKNGIRVKVISREKLVGSKHSFILYLALGKFTKFGYRPFSEKFYILSYSNYLSNETKTYYFKSTNPSALVELKNWIKRHYIVRRRFPVGVWKVRKLDLYDLFTIAKLVIELGSYTKVSKLIGKNSSHIRLIARKFGIFSRKISGKGGFKNRLILKNFAKYISQVDIYEDQGL